MKNNKQKKSGKSSFKIIEFILCFVIVFLVAGIGSSFTKIDGWYESVKPSITPPNFVFPIAWTILFILIAFSMYLAFVNSNKKQKNFVIILFSINLILNILWSYLYFTMHNPLFAFIDLIFLFFSILALIIYNYNINKKSSYLLVPYLLWICFAGLLNYLSI